MNQNILFLHAGESGRGRIDELAAAFAQLGTRVTVEDLSRCDYDRILDAVALADTVVHWPATPESLKPG